VMDADNLSTLAIEERLARGGITTEQHAALLELDARIVDDAPTATSAAVERLARWLRAGQPVVDIERLVFEGDDAVRALVEDLIASVPAPVAWHAVEFVEWLEVGRGAYGVFSVARSARVPAGDSAHRIRLCGTLPDERIREVLPHELAHSLHGAVRKVEPSRRTMPAIERDARALLLGRDLGIDEPETMLADMRADSEFLAEATAAAWGFERPPLYAERLRRHRGFIAELDAAAELVPDIERECRADEAAIYRKGDTYNGR
jgi:hypothetical protein